MEPTEETGAPRETWPAVEWGRGHVTHARIPEWIVYLVSPRELQVYAVLARYADERGYCFPGIPTIASALGVSVSTVQTAVSGLAKAGALDVIARFDGEGRQTTNGYRLHWAPPDSKNPGGRSEKRDRGGSQKRDRLRARDGEDGTSLRAERGPRAKARGSRADENSPPDLLLVAGRNLPHDALAHACGIAADSPRHTEVAAALNGSRKTGAGIRALAWTGYLAATEQPPDRPTVRLNRETEPGRELWEKALARRIRERAELWPRKMGDATLTPTALAKWWTDLPAMPDRTNSTRPAGLTPDEVRARVRDAVRPTGDDPPNGYRSSRRPRRPSSGVPEATDARRDD